MRLHRSLRLTAIGKQRSLSCPAMNLFRQYILRWLLASLGIIGLATMMPAQVTRIHGNKDDRDQLKRAVKLNEVGSAKEVLLRNGFTAEDLENAKITLRTGGGKGGEDEIEISATCCDPKEITIQRSLEYFTK